MQSRFLRYLIITISIVWYAVIVPGHQRGVVTLGSRGPADCCEKESTEGPGSCCSGKTDAKGKNSTPGRGPCAVCDQTAKLTPPPVFELTLRFAGVLAEMEPARGFTLSGVQFLEPIEARGPPMSL